jgi:glycosyltransferase involved in cell wall biosynthesis
MTAIGCVVLTMGNRPESLAAAVRSVLDQRDVEVDVAVVGNGWEPTGIPAGVHPVGLPENRGIPAGRNAGVPHVRGDVLLFLDDDAALGDTLFLRRALDLLDRSPDMGALQPRPSRAWSSVTRPVTATSPRCGRGLSSYDAASSMPWVAGRRSTSTSTKGSSSPGGSSTRATACVTSGA